ncbi:MAG: MBL fold metallo-hydrolase [Candidatus Lokiarchaeota archaeon]|nr:MBL fold metallo-hydrolase [Candidatus Lokiarchaeota archaeon]
MEEVYPGIFLIKQKSYFKRIKPPENIYIIAGPDGIVYDAGYGNRKSVRFFIKELNEIKQIYQENKRSFEITRIIVSHGHPDHISGLKRIREALGVKILLTEKTAEIIRNKKNFKKSFKVDSYKDYFMVQRGYRYKIWNFVRNLLSNLFIKQIYGLSFIADPDEIITENSEISINSEKWRIFHSPGHAIDHISLYNEEKGILLSGDNIFNSMTTWLGPPYSSVEGYTESINVIQKLINLKVILAAHGSLIANPRERLGEILTHRKERTQQVLNIIKNTSENGIGPNEIIRRLYPEGKRMQFELARGWVCLTIKMLENKKLINRYEDKKRIKFYPLNSSH